MPPAHNASGAYIGLGANLPWRAEAPAEAVPPEQTLRLASQALSAYGTILAASSLWHTEPVGPVTNQPPFTNAALAVLTSLAPEALLRHLLASERQFGRARPLGKGPRTLDLDLLLMEESRSCSPSLGTGRPILRTTDELQLPHPELHTRRFVLAPLAEFAPALEHPLLLRTIAGLLRELPAGQRVERLSSPGLVPA